MARPIDPCTEVLARITPVLPAVLHAYRVPVPVAKEIVDDACRTLLAKRRMMLEDPESWLLRTIIENCRRWRKEIQFEDPSE
ncbi:MAG TPA: hypothetical protein VGG20_01455 [Thermoanaerobaculia bacterium]|jgi:hypothetical protein